MIALLTDYSAADHDIGMMERIIAELAPRCFVFNMARSIAAASPYAGQRLLRITLPQFQAGCIFIVLLDVGQSGPSIALSSVGCSFIGPDNGLLTPWFAGGQAVELAHGDRRFVYAQAAGRLAAGTPIRELGPASTTPVRIPLPVPVHRADGTIEGQVLYADRFGNLITNLAVSPDVVACICNRELPVRGTYGSADSGQLLGLISTEGQLEITMRDGNAAAALQAGPGEPVICRPVAG